MHMRLAAGNWNQEIFWHRARGSSNAATTVTYVNQTSTRLTHVKVGLPRELAVGRSRRFSLNDDETIIYRSRAPM